jgi:hypothetical protein
VATVVCALAVGTVLFAGHSASAQAADSPQCQLPTPSTFTYTGQPVQCTVPQGITSLTVTVIGGQGGSCTTCGPGGSGGEAIATVPVQPGDPIRIWVGQQGNSSGGWGKANGGNGGTTGYGGFNGAGGGGASAVAIGTSDSATPLVVAGGGGGGGGNGFGDQLAGSGGAGGAGGNPAGDGAKGQDSSSGFYNKGYGGDGGSGGSASSATGDVGESWDAINYSAGGGGGGGFAHGGGGGAHATSPYEDMGGWVPGGGGGGGGGGDAGVQSPAKAVVYTTATAGGNGSVTLSTAVVQVERCTNSQGTFDVPQNVHQVKVIAVGGQGGTANGDKSGQPGFGARVTATINTNQSQLSYYVGCRGYGVGGWGYGTGGYQGTASADYSGGGGGGGTAVLDATGPLVVAGGGGGPGGAGNGNGGNGGNGGYGPGAAGAGAGQNGGGGTPGQGGQGVWVNIWGQNGEDASVGGGGGGAGGGYTGGGGGGGIGGGDGDPLGGGGGGGSAGSSYARDGSTTDVSYAVSNQQGDGFLIFMYQPPVPSHVNVVGGGGQQAVIGTRYAYPLQVQVTDQNNQPMAGIPVFMFAPGNGASATFANGQTSISVTTGSNGIAMTTLLTANQTPGSFKVVAGGIAYNAETTIPLTNMAAPTGQLLVTQMRLAGPQGGGDEYLVLTNNTATALNTHLWRLRWQNVSGTAGNFVLPALTLPPGGHILIIGNVFSLRSTIWLPDDMLANLDLPTTGVQLVAADQSISDAVGFSGAISAFRLGAGLNPPANTTTQYAYVRNTAAGQPVDTNDNAADFTLVSTDPSSLPGSTLGAPGGQNFRAPVQDNANLHSTLLDPSVPAGSAPNRSYDPATKTLTIRRVITNTGPNTVTTVRLRITSLSTIGVPGPHAMLHWINSSDETVDGTLVKGLALDTLPDQPNGGGLNSSATVPLPSGGLAPGQSVAVAFTFTVDGGGRFWFGYNAEGS